MSFNEALVKLNKAIEETLDCVMLLKQDDLDNHLAEFRKLSEADSKVEQASKLLKGLKNKLSYEVIPKIMEERKIDSIRYDGRLFINSVRLNVSIPEEMQEKGYGWLRDQGLGSIIKESANVKTLSSVVGDYIQETGITPPDDVMKIHRQNYIQIRK